VDDPFACYSLTPFNEIRKNKERERDIRTRGAGKRG
jgi:hypothetical protein